MSLSYSALHVDTIAIPSCVLSYIGSCNSSLIDLANLPYPIDATLCASISSFALRNCSTVVIIAATRFIAPIPSGTNVLHDSGNVSCAKLAVPVSVLITIIGRVNLIFVCLNC